MVSNGPYRLVRHPMYSEMLFATLATPLCLGSYAGGILLAPIALVFVQRLRAEEELLRTALPGYDEYMVRTPHRLIPRVW